MSMPLAAFGIAAVYAALGLAASLMAYRVAELRLRLESERRERFDAEAVHVEVAEMRDELDAIRAEVRKAVETVDDAASAIVLGRKPGR